MKLSRTLIVTTTLLVPLLAIVVSSRATMAAAPGPTVPFQGNYPLTVEAGDYDLLYLVLDFAPGAAIPQHFHGGPATVVGMEGELTLRPDGAPEKKLLSGDVVQEAAGAHHEMINTSNANARILAVILLTKGEEVTTVVASGGTSPPGPTVPFQGSYPITVVAGEYDLVNLVLDFAPGAEIPTHFHGGPAVVVGMDGQLTLRPQGAAEKKLNPGDVVQEKSGALHQMINTSTSNARILAGVLLPKGAELTTVAGTPAGMPRTGAGGLYGLFTSMPALLLIVAGLVLAGLMRLERTRQS